MTVLVLVRNNACECWYRTRRRLAESGLLLISKVVYDYCIYTRFKGRASKRFPDVSTGSDNTELESKTLSMSTPLVGRFPPARSQGMTYEGLRMSNV
jgi:hypothetical protein